MSQQRPRVGIVLGGGGILGSAWLAGALGALHETVGLDPRKADLVVGTSAGSAVGALATAGIAPEHLAAYACGSSLEGLAAAGEQLLSEDEAVALRDAAIALKLERALPRIGPGSLRLALSTLRNPLRHTPSALLAGWLPHGPVSTEGLRGSMGRLVTSWPSETELWAVACDYRTGRRVAFGSSEAPEAEVADAVAASCAIPAFYKPVRIGDRCYVDGGVCSASNLDLVTRFHEQLDVVVCLNPLSCREDVGGRSPLDLLAGAMRAQVGKRLGHEAAKVRRTGTRVVLVQPSADEARLMGVNLMRTGGRDELAELASRTVMRSLRRRDVRESLRTAVGERPARRTSTVQAVRTPLSIARAA